MNCATLCSSLPPHRHAPGVASALLVIIAGSLSTACEVREDVIVIEHVNVIPMDRERVLEDYTVVVEAGVIRDIAPTSEAAVPRGATRIDGSEKFLIPGLVDMHIHLDEQAVVNYVSGLLGLEGTPAPVPVEEILFPYLANGVTAVSLLSGTSGSLEIRSRIEQGTLLAPRFIVSRQIEGGAEATSMSVTEIVAGRDDARAAVRAAKDAGYDRIKVYSALRPEAYDAALEAAAEFGIAVDGHIPNAVTAERVLAAGQNSVSHMEEYVKKVERYDDAEAAYYADLTRTHGTWVVPTLSNYHHILLDARDHEAMIARPEVQYVYPFTVRYVWAPPVNRYPSFTVEQKARLEKRYNYLKVLTKAFHDAGVPLLAGTDALNPPMVPGFSLHDELDELVGAGLSPYDALVTATSNPAAFWGLLDEVGTVAVGKRADLVLLIRNPLEDIQNTKTIAGVLVRGQWLSRDRIDERLQEIALAFEEMHAAMRERQ